VNVLILNYEFPPLGGGAATASSSISNELGKLGHKVTVITSGIGKRLGVEQRGRVSIHRVRSFRKGIHTCGIIGAYSYVLFAIPALAANLKRQRYDVIHYFFGLPTGLLSLFPGLHQRIPSIVSLRGSDVPYYDPHNKTLKYFHQLLMPVTRSIWNRADRVVANSEALRQIALKTDANIDIDVIVNGINKKLFKPTAKFRSKRDNPIRLICVSRLIKRKGIKYLLQALAGLDRQGMELVVVGKGPREKDLKKLCLQLDLSSNVTFMGYVPRMKLPAVYRSADIFVLPTLSDSFSMAFAEATACGLPIISTRTGGIPEIVEDGKNGILVRPGDVDRLRKAIEMLVAEDEIRRYMATKSKARSAKLLTWKDVAILYLNKYESIMKTTPLG
jgi:glycosyltransferase involved in cell wall biosynthesis